MLWVSFGQWAGQYYLWSNEFDPTGVTLISDKLYAGLERYWRWIYTGAIGLFCLSLLHHHYQILAATFPLDYYEGTTALITGLIAAGNNPLIPSNSNPRPCTSTRRFTTYWSRF